MDDLYNKIEELHDALKKNLAPANKTKQSPLVPALSAPSVKPLSMPSASASPGKLAKIPGVTPPNTKDPKKMAEQMKNPRPKAPKIEVLKTDKNGQWALDDSPPKIKKFGII